MTMPKEYNINVDPRILELLGPNLYTNIYYVLAELIANAYDADAKNVYIISNKDDIRIEDDGHGMSYDNGDIKKFLNVAGVSRTRTTALHCRAMHASSARTSSTSSLTESGQSILTALLNSTVL